MCAWLGSLLWVSTFKQPRLTSAQDIVNLYNRCFWRRLPQTLCVSARLAAASLWSVVVRIKFFCCHCRCTGTKTPINSSSVIISRWACHLAVCLHRGHNFYQRYSDKKCCRDFLHDYSTLEVRAHAFVAGACWNVYTHDQIRKGLFKDRFQKDKKQLSQPQAHQR